MAIILGISRTDKLLGIESKYCLLINQDGRRFADETTGDEVINQYLAKQDNRRGFLLFRYISPSLPSLSLQPRRNIDN